MNDDQTMFIVKPVLKTDFTVLPNKLINNERLTPQAFAVLVYLLSKPYNWRANVQDIRNHRKGLSRDGAYKALQELEEIGYLVRQRKQLSDGKFTWIRWVYAEPFTGNPGDGFPEHGEPGTGEPGTGIPGVLVSTDVQKTEVQNTDVLSTDEQMIIFDDPTQKPSGNNKHDYGPEFEAIWKIYPNKKGKLKAFDCFKARLNLGIPYEKLLRATENYASLCKKRQTEQRYILHGSTFFGPHEEFRDYLDANADRDRNEVVDTDRSGGGYVDIRNIKRPT